MTLAYEYTNENEECLYVPRDGLQAFGEKVDKSAVCATCRFFAGTEMSFTVGDFDGQIKFARKECRANPPTASGFPLVKGDCFCGNYERRLNGNAYGIR